MPLDAALAKSEQWMTKRVSLTDGITFETTNRLRVAVALLHLSLEHQTGIHSLVNIGVIGSAFALLRPQFEAYVRGIWYHRCATDAQVSSFIVGEQPPKIIVLIEEIEKLEAFDEKLLSATKRQIWPSLNDFTHGGTTQVKARCTMNEITQNYREEHIANLLAASATWSLLAGVALAAAVGTETLARELHSKFKDIYGPTT
ncbi:MAG: hypothetical protein AB7E73_08750 [Burkholderiales bacterium]